MSDQTRRPDGKARTSVTTEYRVYFAVIFLVALPFSMFTWFRDLVRRDFAALHHGIVGRALSEASDTTPKIFSA